MANHAYEYCILYIMLRVYDISPRPASLHSQCNGFEVMYLLDDCPHIWYSQAISYIQ